ncbi:hypothetical protein QL285_027763 [Trifolium repens]|nr:hypothetical protein QL285_027763 [Trifolium repens]
MIFSLYLLTLVIHLSNVPKFELESSSINKLNLNGSTLATKWDITLTLSLSSIDVVCLYKASYNNSILVNFNYSNEHYQVHLTTIPLVPFSVTKRSTKRKIINLKSQFSVSLNNDVVNDIVVSRSRGTINFGIVFFSLIKLRNNIYEHDFPLKIVCEPLSFVFSPRSSNWVLSRAITCMSQVVSD